MTADEVGVLSGIVYYTRAVGITSIVLGVIVYGI